MKHNLVKVKKFLKEKNWEIFTKRSAEYQMLLFVSKLENIPNLPDLLIKKNNDFLWVYYFWKGTYPFWQSTEGQVTGIDWHKYCFIQGLKKLTCTSVALIFDSELQPEIIFRTIDSLPNPKHCFKKRQNCFRSYEAYRLLSFRCFDCWQKDPHIYRKCYNQKKKLRTGLAIWSKEYFTHDTIYQTKLV